MKKFILITLAGSALNFPVLADDINEMNAKSEQLGLIGVDEAKSIALEAKPGIIDDIDLDFIAQQTEGFSGADLKGLAERIIDPAYAAAMETGQRVKVTNDHVQQALDKSRPSVSDKELKRYAKFRDEGE